ncbi:tetratricopeptide repeat protein [Lujinxingia sediminis]|uniref:Tetratricopeptide repeat protein n=1 Tax=Lujinxingia sediminis TaxID=2480984 RepID=A0ABY0CQE5_9DELT|nr:tetratricopeptide repeat protein [Lujinxingia sediminis]RVU42711.1 tetratricopeptide repeat protein [Lujinxingia sediminis]
MAINRNKVLNAAQKHIRKGNWDKALKEYILLAEDDPSDLRTLLKCGDLYVKLDRVDEALSAYKTVADRYAQQDMYEKAIAVYKQAQRLDDSDVALHHAIGECYFRLGRLKDAVRSFHHAQRMYKELGDGERQRQMLEQMARIDPEDVGLRIQLAERYTRDGLNAQAIEAFSFCAAKLEEEGRHDELLQVLERVLFLTPQRHDLRKQVVRLHLERRDEQTALQHLQILFRETPEDVETLELLSDTFERLGRDDKAVMVLLSLPPLYSAAGRRADAENAWRRIARLDPKNAQAQEALGLASSTEDSGVLAAAPSTDALRARQSTPAPADNLGDVEFLDDDIEFLDDDLEVALAPATTSAAAAPSAPHRSPAPQVPPARPSAPQPHQHQPKVPVAESVEAFVDITNEVEFLDDGTSSGLIEIEAVEAAPASENEIRQMLSECQVFLKYGLYDKAVAAIEAALERSPKSVVAHQQKLDLARATRDQTGAYRMLITLAELTAETPLRAYEFLIEALEVAPNPQAVHVRAQALGIDLNGPPPTEGIAEISIDAIEVVEVSDEPGTMQVDVDAIDDFVSVEPDPVSDSLDFLDEAVVDFLPPSEEFEADEAVHAALETLDSAFDAFGDAPESSLAQATEAEPLSLGDIESIEEIADFDDINVADIAAFESVDASDLMDGLDFASSVVSDDELAFDTNDVVDMDLSQDVAGMVEMDFSALDDAPASGEAPSVNALFADVEADDLFDDLFGDMFSGGDVNIGGDDPMGEMAEIDFFIQQGLTEEASEAINTFEDQHPNHPGLAKRRAQLMQVRGGLGAADNPFGARSLSQKFNPNAANATSKVPAPNFGEVVNSNLELGVAYREMGLLNEALDEFRQAADDPDARDAAAYQIALCELELGLTEEARHTLTELHARQGLSADMRRTVEEQLEALGAQT